MGTKVTLPTVEQVDNSSGLAVLNSNLQILADEFDQALYADGSVTVQGTIDMDSERIINLLPATLSTEPVILSQLAEYAQFDNIDALNQAVTNAQTFAANAAASAASAQSVATALVYSMAFFSYGQSLGKSRSPQVTTTFNNKLLQFNGGNEYDSFIDFTGNDSHWQDSSTNRSSLIGFTPLTSDAEGWGPGLGDVFGKEQFCENVFFHCDADGSRHFRELVQGTGRWANLSSSVYTSKNLLETQQNVLEGSIKPVLIWTQGEADADLVAPGGGQTETTILPSEYVNIMKKLRDDWREELRDIYQDSFSEIPIFVTPLNSQAYDQGTLNIQQSYHDLLDAQEEGIVILPPHYQFWEEMEADTVHLGGQGRRYYSELAGNIIKRIVVDNLTYSPLRWTNLETSGNSVVLTYTPFDNLPIVRDSTTFPDPAIYSYDKDGFMFWDASAGTYVPINSISISGNTVTVNLPVAPATGDYIAYAQQETPGGLQANSITPRGLIRATTSYTAEDGTPLYIYASNQRETI